MNKPNRSTPKELTDALRAKEPCATLTGAVNTGAHNDVVKAIQREQEALADLDTLRDAGLSF